MATFIKLFKYVPTVISRKANDQKLLREFNRTGSVTITQIIGAQQNVNEQKL